MHSPSHTTDHGTDLPHAVETIVYRFNQDGSVNYVEVSGYHHAPELGRFPNTSYTYHGKPDVGQRGLAAALALAPDPIDAFRKAWEQADTGQDPARPRQPQPIA